MIANKTPDEFVELVDDEGNSIGQERRSVAYAKGLKNFRSVEIFLRHPNGTVFITRRAKDKSILPGLYEGCGEHVFPGESDIDAARRGVREEFGLDIPALQFSFLGYTTPLEGLYGHAAAFIAVSDKSPELSDEHDWGAWLKPLDIVHILRKDPRQFRNNARILLSKYAREIFHNN